MSIQTRLVEYADGDLVFEGLLAWDDAVAQPQPGIMVCHAWGGRSDLEDSNAMRLAALGYVGFAADVYGKGNRGANNAENEALMMPLLEDRPLLQGRLLASLAAMRQQPEVDDVRVAAIGYCFGGLCVLDIARSGTDIVGVVSFHGLFTPPGNTDGNTISAKVLLEHGWDDPMVAPEQVIALTEELTSMGADWQLHAYGHTMHAFTNPGANDPGFGTVYNESADKRSWAAMRNFLAELFA